MTSRRRRGSALLTVLWLTAALAAIGLAVASNVRGESERTTNNLDDARAELIARGAVERAAMHIVWAHFYTTPDGAPMYWRYGQPSMQLSFPTAEVQVDIIPETSKLNLNNALPEDLFRLLTILGLPEDRALETAAAIIDWRTPLSKEHESAFDPFYLSQTPSFAARHASFIENEELLLVKGITPELYYGTALPPGPPRPGLKDCISVWGSSNVDINTAPPAVMLASGIPMEDITGILQMRLQNPVYDYKRLQAIQEQLGPIGQKLRYGGRSIYTLRATARLRLPNGNLSDMRRTVAAVVKFDLPSNKENRPIGYDVVRWYDRN